MKKLLSIGLLTVCALAISEHQAQAWVNSKFSIGLNWHLQSANNSTLWGLWRNGQIPGPEAFGPGAGGPPPAGPFMGMAQPNGMPQNGPPQGMMQGMPQGGAAQGALTPSMPNMPNMPQAGMPQNMAAGFPQYYPYTYSPAYNMQAAPLFPQQQQMAYYPNNGWYNNSPFQAVSYQPNAYGYGYNYNYYQPNYNYYPVYGYDVPYYWYGTR